MMKTTIRTYSELILLPTFIERYEYLQLNGVVGKSTFGFDRVFNQLFYTSDEWKSIRNKIILRDFGCDLGVKGYDIHSRILVHHMNPISIDDIRYGSKYLLDPEYLICTSGNTHLAIHYGNQDLLPKPEIERFENDTCPWKI